MHEHQPLVTEAPAAHFDRRIASSYALNVDDVSPEELGDTLTACLQAIQTISSIDICSIQLTVSASTLANTVNVTVEVNEGTDAKYALDKVAES